MTSLAELNALSASDFHAEMERCCGSARWGHELEAARPFQDTAALFSAASEIWRRLDEADWLKAFQHHPRIGDKDALRKKFATTRVWAAGEQAGASDAAEETLQALADGNQAYEQKYGYIFIVCATGKTAAEMLEILRSRLPNDPAQEIRIAAGEQEKITRLRLEKLLNS